ncbi:hypothetical protein V7S43_014356 [Phytophthora oleae]|uniref:Uncharacterized protein n=1 Tax=Phytophthora oleae TaxID=2107226 RepID=A0ABD3F2G9_9STRA
MAFLLKSNDDQAFEAALSFVDAFTAEEPSAVESSSTNAEVSQLESGSRRQSQATLTKRKRRANAR